MREEYEAPLMELKLVCHIVLMIEFHFALYQPHYTTVKAVRKEIHGSTITVWCSSCIPPVVCNQHFITYKISPHHILSTLIISLYIIHKVLHHVSRITHCLSGINFYFFQGALLSNAIIRSPLKGMHHLVLKFPGLSSLQSP